MSIAENIDRIKLNLPEKVKLIAVSKTKPANQLMEAYSSGQREFGENKVQELLWKYKELPKDIKWHFIGHMQSNKVKYIASFIQLIHGVDSFKLLQTIDKEAQKAGRVISCLIQFHIAEEETKFGLSLNEAKEMFQSEDYKKLKYISISGVMGMATYTHNESQISREFASLNSIFDQLKSEFFTKVTDFKEISMGMSDDYLIAVQEGSTMVRIGSNIFGARS